jgi:hypothetical protein
MKGRGIERRVDRFFTLCGPEPSKREDARHRVTLHPA